jgi:GNAT superfamily N-acetyltransferase
MEIDLRPATAEDRSLLVGLIERLYAADHILFDEARVGPALDALLADPALGRVWVIDRIGEPGREPIGYAVVTLGYSLEFGGRFALLDELFLREAHRGAGAGREVLARIEEACRAMGVQALRLEVERENGVAWRLYRKAGFETHDRDLMTLWLDPARRSEI